MSRIAAGAAPAATSLIRQQPEQRPGAGQHEIAFRHQARTLQCALRGACRHHARQRPALYRKRAFQRACGQHDAARPDDPAAAVPGHADLEIARNHPDGRAMQAGDRTVAHAAKQAVAALVVLAQYGAAAGRRSPEAAVNLSARLRVLVEQQHVHSLPRSGCRRGETRRACSDDREITDGGQFAHIAEQLHGAIFRFPAPVSTRIPLSIGTRQACRFAIPSIATRHSKQTPIRQ